MTENERSFANYRKQLVALGADLDQTARRVITQMRNVGIATTKRETPVGRYDKNLFIDTKNKAIRYASFNTSKGRVTFRVKHVKQGGTLKRNWRMGKTYRVGNGWESGYSNNTSYAIYVNNGHRITKAGAEGRITIGQVKGKRMLQKGMGEANARARPIFEAEIAKLKRKSGF